MKLRMKKKVKTEQILLLNKALEKLVELDIARIEDGKYKYSRNIYD